MPESTLATAYTNLTQAVGIYLGYGDGLTVAWTSDQTANILYCVRVGLAQFYRPPVVPPYGLHDWSFLKPVATLTLPSGSQDLPLPDDFGGFEGMVTAQVSGGTTRFWWPIKLMPEGAVRAEQMRLPTTSGPPQMVGLQWLKGTTLNAGQRAQLTFWPLADTDYTLRFQYYLLGDMISGQAPYVYGGAGHANTVLASCKYVAERDLDDIGDGPQKMGFYEALAASIGHDRKSKPQSLGYNGDRSDWVFNRTNPGQRFHGWNYGGITYQGQAL